jgi:hypothetical protein
LVCDAVSFLGWRNTLYAVNDCWELELICKKLNMSVRFMSSRRMFRTRRNLEPSVLLFWVVHMGRPQPWRRNFLGVSCGCGP